ncbi:Src homology 2 domain containing F [Cricetulus griseus]|uniref:Src homology 2 domain containing F n=1 Tax=Cricetulus griseus TaxID=10029 RepID=A0A061IME4_CRIGR|nr:Src homology 2 domain containing F [Cricetulus griseus]
MDLLLVCDTSEKPVTQKAVAADSTKLETSSCSDERSSLFSSVVQLKDDSAVTRIRTEVAAATTQSTNHYTITASHEPSDNFVVLVLLAQPQFQIAWSCPALPTRVGKLPATLGIGHILTQGPTGELAERADRLRHGDTAYGVMVNSISIG